MELQVASFALLIKRRTLIYTALVLAVLFTAQLLFSVKLADKLDVHDPLQEYLKEVMHLESLAQVDKSITWAGF